MNFTEQDKRFFEALSKTETGRYFADYVKRVIDCVHDSRQWSSETTRVSAEDSARIIKEHILDRIRPSNGGSKIGETYE